MHVLSLRPIIATKRTIVNEKHIFQLILSVNYNLKHRYNVITYLDKNEQLIFKEIINTHNDYKEVKMLQSIEEVGYEKGIEKGLEQGLEQGEDNVLKGLLKAGLLAKDLDKIVQTTGIDSERVKKIIQELNL